MRAPDVACARSAAALAASASRRNGTFSAASRARRFAFPTAAPSSRRSGYTSRTRSTNGTVACAFDRSAIPKSARLATYQATGRRAVARTIHATSAPRTKAAESTSRRSVAQATDSTRNGCSANSAAARRAAAPRSRAPHPGRACRSIRSPSIATRPAFRRCNATFSAWQAAGPGPKSVSPTVNESHVSGW